ncbi:MAG: hypothetical protein KDB80_10255, partial [Planctomycetes bacterium]|nr:hypothetical protein [Planctomycetota bacterium]
DHWECPRDRIGQDAVFVLPRPEMRGGFLDRVRNKFDSVERVDQVKVSRLGITVLEADIFVCRNYRGPSPGG